ncbi:hypothetical protein H2200_012778 [Cladophialophora chaetospira]|uniref:Ankyrin repeat protein n=1 Tax=Cladophialophora chaetospira TaxID=386627 RepID=A0AA39CBW8_9EURO|nr:hypothetical protein H2200_012778 [Cladophialophora chaetospira]
MPSVGNIPPRLPPKEKLRSALAPTNDLARLNNYLQVVAKQPKGQENGLRILLQTCAELGKEKYVEALLCRGADVNAFNKTSIPALHYAAKAGHVGTIEVLLSYDAAIDLVDSGGRTALMHAALNGQNEVVQKLLEKGASIELKDKQGRNVVIHAGGHVDTLDVLLRAGAKSEHADDAGKTAAICAASNNDPNALRLLLSRMGRTTDNDGRSILAYAISNEKASLKDKKEVLTLLLDVIDVRHDPHSFQSIRSAALIGQNEILELLISHNANVNAIENGLSPLLHLASDTGKPKWNEQTLSILMNAGADFETIDPDRKRTPLQWAAATGHESIAKAILQRVKSDHVNKASNRGKTALHLAAQHNNTGIIRLLLNHGAIIDGRSEGGWTPLLIAAKAGHLEAVETLLAYRANINARTSSGMTSLHWAAENGYTEVVRRILHEEKAWKNPKDAFDTTPLSRAGRKEHEAVIELLKDCLFSVPASKDAAFACDNFQAAVVDFYLGRGEHDRNEVRRMPVRKVLYDRDEKKKFAITTKLSDIQKGAPSFRWIHLPANNLAWAEVLITKMLVEDGPIGMAGFQSMLRIFGQQQHRGSQIHSRFMRPLCQLHGNAQVYAPKLSLSTEFQPISHESTATFDDFPSRRRLTIPGTPGTPSPSPSRQTTAPTTDSKLFDPKHEIGVLFMPYLHWETDSNRQNIRDTVRAVLGNSVSASRSRDDCLIRGYLRQSTDLHLRRTLDQFRHSSINTDKRDKDQVVYRHHVRNGKEDPKIYMVDQMWIWIFKGIIITCFPERWGQPVRDPLNLFDGVIEDINSNIYPPVKSVHDLAAAITNRCTGSFDRHEWGYEDVDFMFFEIFELSIGTLTRRATCLLERFETDTTAAMKWLNQRDDSLQLPKVEEPDPENEDDEWLRDDEDSRPHNSSNPVFVNRLLNISKETQLLVECKDIEDELETLTTVLEQQHRILKYLDKTLKIPKRRAGPQVSLVEQHLLDIKRMQKQAEGVNSSLTQVLDLKQKHANAIEARFARDQAESTARQGQAIVVFTIVTIVFLPLSFMAAFFTLNVVEFHGDRGLRLSWVSQYLFGIGFAVSIPLIAVALSINDIRGWIWRRRTSFGRKPQPPTVPQTQPTPIPVARNSFDSEHRRYARRKTRINTVLSDATVDSV